MKRYTSFNKHYVKKHIDELLKLKKQLEESNEIDFQKYIQLINDINELNILLNNKNIKTLYDKLGDDPYDITVSNNRRFFKEQDYTMPIIEEFDETYQNTLENLNLEGIEYEEFKNTAYTHKHILNVIHDFYNSIPDKEIKDIFNKVYKDRIYNVRFTQSTASYTAGTTFDLKRYISIDSEINYSCFGSLAHEYGHVIQDNFLGKRVAYENSQYTELLPLFFQLLFSEYFSNLEPKFKKREQIENAYLIIKMENYARNLIILDRTKDMNFKDREEAYNYYLNYLFEEEAEMAAYYDADLFHDYLMPYIISIEILWQYKSDPEKAMYILKEIAKNYEVNYIEETKKLGLTLNSHVPQYMEHLIK